MEHRKPLWLLPNLLSLDAPLVSVAWLYIFAKTWLVQYHEWQNYVALGLAVWVVYVADRLLDALIQGPNSALSQARHRFHYRHRKLLGAGALLAGVAAVGFVVGKFPMTIFPYLTIAVVLLAGFLSMSLFTSRSGETVPYGKNILAGCAFAFGTAMMAHVYIPGGAAELVTSRELLCFAALCTLNISAIDIWEHAAASKDPEVKAADELALTVPLTLLAAAALWFAYLDHEMTTRPFFYAILTGSALLYIINRSRNRFSLEALRVLADLALLAPLLLFVEFPGSQ